MGNTERSSGASTGSPWRSALARFSELPGLHPVFIVAGSINSPAVVAIHGLTPRLEMVKIA
jgi:hypothetical protein